MHEHGVGHAPRAYVATTAPTALSGMALQRLALQTECWGDSVLL